ncbi:hypothetical protein [Streptomyces lichenis]|uniref:DUF3558 domain-containing protein n=1 Tax=Streptomyces lichenis TaxID=2306967 RepID=A0ABT0I7T2_9ACTN|nr:hypothetical protein [Streptomyces lichenis]MCK8677373.1 hypothetical protein [Streptomyces lichenis]
MSTPPPSSPPGPGPHQPGGPVEHNPYAQPLGHLPGQPGPGGPYPPIPHGPPAPPGGRRRVPGWVWGLGGVLVASAVWAGALFGSGVLDDPEPEFGGHRYAADLCETFRFEGFEERYDFQDVEDGDAYGSRQQAVDQSSCSRRFNAKDAEDTTLADGYLSAQAVWHKGSDPAPEFASLQSASEDRSTDDYTYEVAPAGDLGDEAYTVTTVRKSGTGEKEVGNMSLAARDGWFTLELSWSWYGSDDEGEVPTRQELRRLLDSEMRSALEALRK